MTAIVVDPEKVRAARLIALAVGVNDYGPDSGLDTLSFAENDVDLVSRCLTPKGYYVVPLKGTEATSENVRTVIKELSRHATADRCDTFVFFFAGHGKQRANDQHHIHLYNSEAGLDYGSLPTADIIRMAAPLRAKRILFVLDACRTDGAGPVGSRGSGGTGMPAREMVIRFLEAEEASTDEPHVYYLISCSPGQASYEDPEWKQGIFTRVLVCEIEEKWETQPLDRLHKWVGEGTAERCKVKGWKVSRPQWVAPAGLGDFYIGALSGNEQRRRDQEKERAHVEFRMRYDKVKALEVDGTRDPAALVEACASAIRICQDPVVLAELRGVQKRFQRKIDSPRDTDADVRQLVDAARRSAEAAEAEFLETEHQRRLAQEEVEARAKDTQKFLAGLEREKAELAEIRKRNKTAGDAATVEGRLSLVNDYLSAKDQAKVLEQLDEAEAAAGNSPQLIDRVRRRREFVTAFFSENGMERRHEGIDYVLIRPGEFRMGPPGAERMERIIEPFWISKAPVCGAAWNKFDRRIHRSNYPVVDVSFNLAKQFCLRAGGRLPTEREWELAARGVLESCRYPWGEHADATLANCGGSGIRACGSQPQNVLGLVDLIGNVWEWCDSPFDSSTRRRVIKGGSWEQKLKDIAVWDREGRDPAQSYSNVSFRCVLPT